MGVRIKRQQKVVIQFGCIFWWWIKLATIFARGFNQNVSASLDSLVMETANPCKNKLYRAVSRWRKMSFLGYILFSGSLYLRWTFHNSLPLPRGRSFGREERKTTNHAGTARFHGFYINVLPSFPSSFMDFISRCTFLSIKVSTKVNIPSDWGEWKREAVVSTFFCFRISWISSI